MMQQYRRKYPDRWEEMARQCKEAAGWKCEECGAAQFELRTSRRGSPYLVYLHAAHVNNDPGNPDPELKALCISCHAKLDYERKQREARVRLEILKHLKLLISQGMIEIQAYYEH